QFLDAFDPGHICNHSDTSGRYAFNQQPNVAYWNLFCLAQALLPLIGEEERAMAALASYRTLFPAGFEGRMRTKLGLGEAETDDLALIDTLLRLLAVGGIDWSIFWRRFAEHRAGAELAPVRDLFLDSAGFDAWMLSFSERLAQEPRALEPDSILKANPKFVLRNHLAQEAIEQAQRKDFSGVSRLLALMQAPYDDHPGMDAMAGFPPDWASTIEISCSS
ncbi:MAG: hypothetical protein DI563_31565, partial [Variovorax paradoxus]